MRKGHQYEDIQKHDSTLNAAVNIPEPKNKNV